ncbi:MAG: glycosyltransferase family 2 protein [Lachnospira sp.]
MPVVSVIVPIYNAEDTLDYCVKSILSQTFEDYELILIDDGSTDNSGNKCDDYQNENDRVRVFHKKNGGVSSARNFGIEQAVGDYIMFVDSDDYIEKRYLEYLVNFKNQNKQIDNIWCHFKTVSNHNQFVDSEISSKEGYEMASIKEIMDLHERWLDAAPYCKLFDRSIIIDNGITFPTDLSLGEDLIFNFNYLDKTNGKIAILNNTLYYYYIGDELSLSNRYYPDMFSIYKRLNKIMYDYLIKWDCPQSQITKLFNASFYKYEEVLRNTFNDKNMETTNKKYRYNNSVIKSSEFQNAYNNGDFRLNLLYRLAYSTHNYRIVRSIDRLIKFVKG